jgi:DNA-binding NarL/FixJ family response regulator
MKRIVVVDDHPLMCSALTALFVDDPVFVVVGTAGEARAAYDLVARADPDIVTVDLGLPGINGIGVTRELVRRNRARKILMLTMDDNPDFVAQAFRAGALGYALKRQAAPEIRAAIVTVSQGTRYLAPPLQSDARVDRARDGHGPLSVLTARELEIFGMLVRGADNGRVARQLAISVKTVETHRARIMKKLGIHSLAEMTRLAMRHQLVSPTTREA